MAFKPFDVDVPVLGNNYSRIILPLEPKSDDLVEIAKHHRDVFVN